MAIKRSSKVSSSFSSSSMTDLIFLLLVFFVLATTMIKVNNVVQLTLPSSSSQDGDPSVVTLMVNADDSEDGYIYAVQNEKYDNINQANAALRSIYRERMEGSAGYESLYLSLHCDEKEVNYGSFVAVLDMINDVNSALKTELAGAVEQPYRIVLATKDAR